MLRRAAAQWRGGLRSLAPLTGGWAALPPSTRPHSTSSDSESSDEELGADQRAFLDELHAAAAALEDGSAGVQPDLVELLGVPPPDARDTDVPPEQQRLLQAGVVGAPNAGKSTLVNQLCGAKVSAVSPKTNTTEQSRLGAFTYGTAQVVLYDTPGVVDKQHFRNPAHQHRVRSAWTVAGDCDLLLFLVDAARELRLPDPRIHRLLADSASAPALGLEEGWSPPPALLVLNKVDAVPRPLRPQLLQLADRLRRLRPFEDVFFVSAKDGRGVPELRQLLLDRATPGEWTLEPGMATDRGEDEQALEAVREQLFMRLYKELPYALRLRLASCRPLDDGSVHIEIEVLVPHESQRRIVIGAGGGTIAGVCEGAQRELEEAWGHPVRLHLRVKADKA